MDNKDVIYQTLEQFLFTPFGVADTEEEKRLEPKYKVFKNLIKFVEYAMLEDSYYMHLWIPSESDPQKHYDVVIQFFPTDDNIKKKDFLNNYVVNFFSNSPSFVYRYAVLYKIHGYMIDALQEKMDPAYADKLPESSNKNMKLSFDKSLYFACKFLYDNRLIYLSKSTLKLQKKVPFHTLVDNIQFNKDVLGKSGREIEQKAKEEQKKDTKDAKEKFDAKAAMRQTDDGVMSASPFVQKRKPLSKKIAKSATTKTPVNKFVKPVAKKAKKTARTTTRH